MAFDVASEIFGKAVDYAFFVDAASLEPFVLVVASNFFPELVRKQAVVHPLLRVAPFDPHLFEPDRYGLKVGLFPSYVKPPNTKTNKKIVRTLGYFKSIVLVYRFLYLDISYQKCKKDETGDAYCYRKKNLQRVNTGLKPLTKSTAEIEISIFKSKKKKSSISGKRKRKN